MNLWTVARRNLFRRPLRSTATLSGTALAVTTMVTLVGLAGEFESSFRQLLESRGVDLVVFPANADRRAGSVVDERLGDRLRTITGVGDVTPILLDMTSLGQDQVIGIPLSGWPANSPLFAQLNVTEGRLFGDADGRVAVIGRGLARRLGKTVGDTIEIEVREFRVIGIYESQNLYENGAVIVPLRVLQELIDRSGKVSGFALFLLKTEHPDDAATEVAAVVREMRDAEGRPVGLEAERPQQFAAHKIEIRFARAIAWMTSTIAFALTSIMILNTMLMSVGERTAEIGILRAIGWCRRRIISLVLCEAILLNLAGAAIGSVGGLVLVRLLSYLPMAEGLVSGHIPPVVLGQSFGLGLVTGVVGGLYPAIRAAGLAPTEAIRHV